MKEQVPVTAVGLAYRVDRGIAILPRSTPLNSDARATPKKGKLCIDYLHGATRCRDQVTPSRDLVCPRLLNCWPDTTGSPVSWRFVPEGDGSRAL